MTAIAFWALVFTVFYVLAVAAPLWVSVFLYLLLGSCSTIAKHNASNSQDAYFSVTKKNWWKSVLFWPLELYWVSTSTDDNEKEVF